MSPAPAPSAPAVPAPPAAQGFTSRGLLGLAAVFLGTVAAAWAWFHVGATTPAGALRFEVRREIPGWRFDPDAVSPQEEQALATTNLFNGSFRGPRGERVGVFAGEWHASNARQLSVVQHTPDLCWVKVGWRPFAGEHPDRLSISLGGHTVPFESRVFVAPGSGDAQLVVWCTLISGRPAEEGRRFAAEAGPADSRDRFIAAGRRLAANHFLESVRLRRAATGDKQFIRLSVPYHGDFPAASSLLSSFANEWLRPVLLAATTN